jgi:hypothetical protein
MVTLTKDLSEQVMFHGFAFNKEWFSSERGWYRFTEGKALKESDFIDKDHYTRYFLLNLELVDWATVVITGQKRSGKSLFMVWLASTLREMFRKGVTFNFRPREGDYDRKEGFGEFFYLTEQSLLDEHVKVSQLADRQDAHDLTVQVEYLTSLSPLYNHVIGLDEARKWLGKYKQNGRIAQDLSELKDLAGHYHNIFLYSMPNALEELGKYTVLNDRTHEVHCSFNTHYVGCSTYAIKHINSGRVRWMHLPAKKFGYLWNSWNLIGMSKPITSKQLKEAHMKARGEFSEV